MEANGDGIWNKAPAETATTILALWHRSTPACIMYALLVALVFWRLRK